VHRFVFYQEQLQHIAPLVHRVVSIEARRGEPSFTDGEASVILVGPMSGDLPFPSRERKRRQFAVSFRCVPT